MASFEKAIIAYWDYFSRAKDIHQEMVQNYGTELVNLLGLAWQYFRKATNSKNYLDFGQNHAKDELEHPYLDL